MDGTKVQVSSNRNHCRIWRTGYYGKLSAVVGHSSDQVCLCTPKQPELGWSVLHLNKEKRHRVAGMTKCVNRKESDIKEVLAGFRSLVKKSSCITRSKLLSVKLLKGAEYRPNMLGRWFWFEFELLQLSSIPWLQQTIHLKAHCQIYSNIFFPYQPWQHIRILAGDMTGFDDTLKSRPKTIPRVIWQCPFHFLWPHVDFLFMCSSCNPILTLSTPKHFH